MCEQALTVLDRRDRGVEHLTSETYAEALRVARSSGAEAGPACCRAEEGCRRSLAVAEAAVATAEKARAEAARWASAAWAFAVVGWALAVLAAIPLWRAAAPIAVARPGRPSLALESPTSAGAPRARPAITRPSDLRHGRPEPEHS